MATMGEVPWIEVRSVGICLKMVLSVKVMRDQHNMMGCVRIACKGDFNVDGPVNVCELAVNCSIEFVRISW